MKGKMTRRVTAMRLASWLAFLSIAVLCSAMQGNADPVELDDWCSQVSQPSSIALCSDPELRELAIQRNHAFEAARVRLSKDVYNTLLRDQKSWVRSYSTACGISPTAPPALPLSPETLDCMKRAGQARVDYLWNYAGAADASVPSPTRAAPPQIAGPRFAACADTDWGCKSSRLREDETEQEVIATIGYRPNKVELKTCGSQSRKGPWDCKVYVFGSLDYNLEVLFHQDYEGGWRVNGWFVFP
jgi:hypothetical protein